MHTFIVVARKPGKRVPNHLLDLLEQDDVPELYFEPESHLSWSSISADIHFGGWQAATSLLGVGSHWSVADDGLTAFAGRPFPKEGGWTGGDSWAAQLSSRFQRRPLAQSLESLRGVFSLISLGSSGGGCIASDPLGLGVIYIAETDEFTAFSNRAALAARALAPPSRAPVRDPIGVGWLAFCGYIIGDATGFKGVRAIPQGTWVELDPVHGPLLREPPNAPWRFGAPEAAADADQLIDLVRDDLAAALHAALDVPAPHRADITGGKDTRLILSLLISEGLADKIDFQTIGELSLPDVLIGKEVARRFGLEHQAHPPLPLAAEGFEQQLRIHTFQTSGLLGASDLIGRSFAAQHLHISGACGEMLRTNYPEYRDIRDADHMLGAFRAGMHFDTLNLIKPDLRAQYDQWAADSLLVLPWDHSEPLDLIDIFYLRNRLRRWLGTEQETNFSNRVFPLYSMVGVRTAFAIGPTRRRSELIPFEIMRRCGAELAKMPLAKARWAEDLLRDLPDAGEFRVAAPSGPPETPQQKQQRVEHRRWQAQTLRRNKNVFRRLLATDPDHPVFEVLDREAVVAAVDHAEDLTLHGRIQLYGAVTAAIWLGGEESEWRFSTDPAN